MSVILKRLKYLGQSTRHISKKVNQEETYFKTISVPGKGEV
jgi:hypothetical protein